MMIINFNNLVDDGSGSRINLTCRGDIMVLILLVPYPLPPPTYPPSCPPPGLLNPPPPIQDGRDIWRVHTHRIFMR